MDTLEYLKEQIGSMRSLQESVLKEISDEAYNHGPLGTISSIGVIWLHMVAGEDGFLSIITGDETLWESKGWKDRFGLEKTPNFGEDWKKYEEVVLPIELLREYTTAVKERCQQILERVTLESLDETVKFFTDSDPKSSVWILLVGHTLLHAGEISAIKGVLGDKGLPF